MQQCIIPIKDGAISNEVNKKGGGMFKKLVIILMVWPQMSGMNGTLAFPPPPGVTIYNFHTTNNHWHYHHHDHTTLKTRVNRLERRSKAFRTRIEKLERQVDKGNIFSRIFNYYGLLGMSAMLSAITVQHAAGFIEFKYTTFPDLVGDLAVIASCGYCTSLWGVASNKTIDALTRQKPDSKIDWILPTAFGALGFLVSWKPLNKIILSQLHDMKYQIIGSGLFLATTFLSGAIIHYTHQKLYGYSKYRK